MEERFMHTEAPPASVSQKMLWAGRIMSTLPVLMLVMSGIMKLLKPPPVKEGFTHLGLNEDLPLGLGILELTCAEAATPGALG
jgi:DoxX-like family